MTTQDVWMAPAIAGAIALALTAACGSNKGSPAAPTPTVTSVEVTFENALLRPGDTMQASATATMSNNQTQDITVGFQSDSPAVAKVSGSGLVTAVAEGRANIFVVTQGRQGVAQVRVMGSPLVVTFNGFAGFGSGSHAESGATVTPVSGPWTLSGYGNPGPASVFPGFQYMGPSVSGELAITFGGGLFTFALVDLYSSLTPIPWEFTGYRKSVQVFTATGQQGNTFGLFVTTANPRASEPIDRLIIKLTQLANTIAPCLGGACTNPMGLDNIVIY